MRFSGAQVAALVAGTALLLVSAQLPGPLDDAGAAAADAPGGSSGAASKKRTPKRRASSRDADGDRPPPRRARFSLNMTMASARRGHRARVATVSRRGQTRTYAEVVERVQRAATALRRTLGIKAGARVAILALNAPAYLEFFWACPHAGLLAVPLNVRLAPPEIVQILNQSGATVLFVDDAFAPAIPKLAAAVSLLEHVVYIGERDAAPEGALHYESDLIASVRPQDVDPPADVAGDDVYGIFFTGGTTGQSKGVMLTHHNLLANATCVMRELAYDESTRYAHVAPMFHLADSASTFAVTMVGAAHVFLPKFAPRETADLFEEQRVTHTLLVPTMVSMLLNLPDLEDRDFASLQTVLYGASPMPTPVLERAMRVFGAQTNWVQGYGMTELSPVATFLSARDHRAGGPRLRSAGRPVAHVEVRVVGHDGRELEIDQVGELQVRGASVMAGYYEQPDLTRAVISEDGWLSTGDGASIDGDGYVYIRDRIKDIIVTGGENVYSAAVESAIASHPGVDQVAVIATPDDTFVEAVTAIVVPKAGARFDEDAVIDFCRGKLANFECPKHVVIRNEPLPLSGAGKVLKAELRKPFWENAAFDDPSAADSQAEASAYQ